MQKMHNANSDKPVATYSLDVVLSVGYRTNSKVAIEFRKWATQTLRSYITEGYAINKRVVKNNYAQFQKAIKNIKQLLPTSTSFDHENVLELVSAFADTWLSLDAYDKNKLHSDGATKKKVQLTSEHLAKALADFRALLIMKGEASKMFGVEKTREHLAGIVGNVMQTFDGSSLYNSVEEKAAHLFYYQGSSFYRWQQTQRSICLCMVSS